MMSDLKNIKLPPRYNIFIFKNTAWNVISNCNSTDLRHIWSQIYSIDLNSCVAVDRTSCWWNLKKHFSLFYDVLGYEMLNWKTLNWGSTKDQIRNSFCFFLYAHDSSNFSCLLHVNASHSFYYSNRTFLLYNRLVLGVYKQHTVAGSR